MSKPRLIPVTLFLNLLISLSVPAQTVNLEDVYEKGNRLSYHGYEVTRSLNERTGVSSVTIKKGGRVLKRFDDGGRSLDFTNIALFALLGGDTKQLVIDQYSGGAHCCTSFWVYDLAGPALKQLYDSARYDVGISPVIVDIDRDGIYEFTQTVMAFDYFDDMAHAESPFPRTAFKYDKSAGRYVPATGRVVTDYLLSEVGKDVDEVKKLNRGLTSTRRADVGGGYVGAVLQVALQYIYTGREQEGWDFYDREYRLDDKARMKMKVTSVLRKSAVYNSIYRRANRRGAS